MPSREHIHPFSALPEQYQPDFICPSEFICSLVVDTRGTCSNQALILLPGIGRGFRSWTSGRRVVEEGVLRAGIDGEIVRFAERRQLLIESSLTTCGLTLPSFSAKMPRTGARSAAIRLDRRETAVEIDAGRDPFGVVAGGEEGERAPHAEADDPDRLAGQFAQVLDRAAHILRGALDIQLHHHLPGLVRLGGDHAVIEIGRERVIARRREALGDIFDMLLSPQPPPLLEDDHARTTSLLVP